MANKKIIELLGNQADSLLNHTCKTILKNDIFLPNPNHVDDIWRASNRTNQTLKSLQKYNRSWPPWRYGLCLHFTR